MANTVLLEDGDVTAFDCIEFDPALRWIDVMEDLAFVTIDLKGSGKSTLADGLLKAAGAVRLRGLGPACPANALAFTLAGA